MFVVSVDRGPPVEAMEAQMRTWNGRRWYEDGEDPRKVYTLKCDECGAWIDWSADSLKQRDMHIAGCAFVAREN